MFLNEGVYKMKKLTLFIVMLSLGVSHTNSYSGMVKAPNKDAIEFTIHSDVDVYGVQFDLDYDRNLSDPEITSLVNTADVYFKVIEPGKARVIMFSMQGDKIMTATDDVASVIDISFGKATHVTASISDLILAGANGVSIPCEKDATFEIDMMPETTSLKANYPNPFNPSTTIPFDIAQSGSVVLNIYDMSGSLVKTLVSGHKEADSYEVVWNGLNNDGQQVASGQYILKMNAPNFTSTSQMTFIK